MATVTIPAALLDERIATESDVEHFKLPGTTSTDFLGLGRVSELLEQGDTVFVKHSFVSARGKVSVESGQHGVGIIENLPDGLFEVMFEHRSGVPLRFNRDEEGANFLIIPKLLRHRFREICPKYEATFDVAKFGHIEKDMTIVDRHIDHCKAHLSSVTIDGPELAAAEVVVDRRQNLWTLVLATVMCPGWHASWCMNIVNLITSCQPICRMLSLVAVKGGWACDQEILFIERLMPRLGFKVLKSASKPEGGNRLQWMWELARDGAEPYRVNMNQLQNVEQAHTFENQFGPTRANIQAPNLRRVAVVSAPVVDKHGEPINERLNAILLKSLDAAGLRAQEKGFAPDGDVHSAEYKSYFDQHW